MDKKRSFKSIEINSRKYNVLALPNTNFFKFEVINMFGSHVERVYKSKTNKNVYGLSHLVEHLSFRNSKDYTTEELLEIIMNDGNYNASTDFGRINYWFQTISDKSKLAINVVLNYAMNDLTKISEEEFQIEKKIVYNEAKRYADDYQNMFYFDVTPTICSYDKEDNIIGAVETIDKFTLEDAIELKKIMLSNDDVFYNITYDPLMLDINDIISEIENQLSRYEVVDKTISLKTYLSNVRQPAKGEFYIGNESKQIITSILFDNVKNTITADAANDYLAYYASKTSLNDIIREKNGLTYGISLYTTNLSYKEYSYFTCDVTAGNEQLLLELISESINSTLENWSTEAYDKYMRTKKLKRSMNLLDQKNYGWWHNLAVWNEDTFEELTDIAAKDLDEAYEELDKLYCSETDIKNYLQNLKYQFDNKDYSIVRNI